MAASLPSDADDFQARVGVWSAATGVRITLIAADGTVLADSSRDPEGMEDHSDRPEVISALRGEVGVASRISASVGVEFRYVAIPPGPGPVIRMAQSVTAVQDRLAQLRSALILGGLGTALIGVLAVWLVARRLSQPIRRATSSVSQIAAGGDDATMTGPRVIELEEMVEAVRSMASELQERVRESDEERALRDRLLQTLDEGVLLIDGADAVAYANRWATDALGDRRTVAELPAALQRLCLVARSTGEAARDQFEHGLPTRVLIASAAAVDDAGGVVLVLQDVTAARRVEAMRRDFVADASHELKTPIAAIQAGAETIARAIGDDREAAAGFAEQIHQNAVRLGRIVSDLLDLSRLEAEESRFELVQLDRLVAGEVERSTGPDEGASRGLTAALSPVAVSGSPEDLRLAVRNLLENAQRYAAEGEVRVSVFREGSEGVIEVSDTGIGIPKRDLPRIFERFYRVDVARSRHTGGTGLGLAIVRHVAERHGGTVSVESELGVGSTFRLRLPAVDPRD